MWPPAPASPLAGLHLLVADDVGAIRHLYADVLRRAGAEVAEAEDGTAAEEAWRAPRDSGRPFDAVLLDHEMPGLDGSQVAARLRAAGSSGTIVGVSAEVTTDGEDRWRAAGCDKVFSKGLPLAELVATVAAACGRRAS